MKIISKDFMNEMMMMMMMLNKKNTREKKIKEILKFIFIVKFSQIKR